MSDPATLTKIRELLCQFAHPKRILVFGSHAGDRPKRRLRTERPKSCV